MGSPYDEDWLLMRDVELQLNNPRTVSITVESRELIANPFTGVRDGSYVESFRVESEHVAGVGFAVCVPYRRKDPTRWEDQC